jgi:hypothetical protein
MRRNPELSQWLYVSATGIQATRTEQNKGMRYPLKFGMSGKIHDQYLVTGISKDLNIDEAYVERDLRFSITATLATYRATERQQKPPPPPLFQL